MNWMISFIISVLMALINLPFVLEDGGSIPNLIGLIFCSSMALFALVMAATGR